MKSWSKDPKRKVGALLVSPDRRSVSWGYNGLPQEVDDGILETLTQKEKNQVIIHAERNAIDNCPSKVRGWTLYATRFSCSQCASAIIQNGIIKVVSPPPEAESSWFSSVQMARRMLVGVGVEIIEADCV